MKSLSGKKLLILAGTDLHCKVVRAAKEMGIYTVVTDYITDSPAKHGRFKISQSFLYGF